MIEKGDIIHIDPKSHLTLKELQSLVAGDLGKIHFKTLARAMRKVIANRVASTGHADMYFHNVHGHGEIKGISRTKLAVYVPDITHWTKKSSPSLKKIEHLIITARKQVCDATGWTGEQYDAMVKLKLINVYTVPDDMTTVDIRLTVLVSEKNLVDFLHDSMDRITELQVKLGHSVQQLSTKNNIGEPEPDEAVSNRALVWVALDDMNMEIKLHNNNIANLPDVAYEKTTNSNTIKFKSQHENVCKLDETMQLAVSSPDTSKSEELTDLVDSPSETLKIQSPVPRKIISEYTDTLWTWY